MSKVLRLEVNYFVPSNITDHDFITLVPCWQLFQWSIESIRYFKIKVKTCSLAFDDRLLSESHHHTIEVFCHPIILVGEDA